MIVELLVEALEILSSLSLLSRRAINAFVMSAIEVHSLAKYRKTLVNVVVMTSYRAGIMIIVL